MDNMKARKYKSNTMSAKTNKVKKTYRKKGIQKKVME